jgi:hypothetical protein
MRERRRETNEEAAAKFQVGGPTSANYSGLDASKEYKAEIEALSAELAEVRGCCWTDCVLAMPRRRKLSTPAESRRYKCTGSLLQSPAVFGVAAINEAIAKIRALKIRRGEAGEPCAE